MLDRQWKWWMDHNLVGYVFLYNFDWQQLSLAWFKTFCYCGLYCRLKDSICSKGSEESGAWANFATSVWGETQRAALEIQGSFVPISLPLFVCFCLSVHLIASTSSLLPFNCSVTYVDGSWTHNLILHLDHTRRGGAIQSRGHCLFNLSFFIF